MLNTQQNIDLFWKPRWCAKLTFSWHLFLAGTTTCPVESTSEMNTFYVFHFRRWTHEHMWTHQMWLSSQWALLSASKAELVDDNDKLCPQKSTFCSNSDECSYVTEVDVCRSSWIYINIATIGQKGLENLKGEKTFFLQRRTFTKIIIWYACIQRRVTCAWVIIWRMWGHSARHFCLILRVIALHTSFIRTSSVTTSRGWTFKYWDRPHDASPKDANSCSQCQAMTTHIVQVASSAGRNTGHRKVPPRWSHPCGCRTTWFVAFWPVRQFIGIAYVNCYIYIFSWILWKSNAHFAANSKAVQYNS